MAQKRRITPIMVSSEVSTAAQVPQLQQAAPAQFLARPTQSIAMSMQEQSDKAAKTLGPGRFIYVALNEDYNEINWPRVSSDLRL